MNKSSLKIKFTSISVDAWLVLLPKPDFTLVATDPGGGVLGISSEGDDRMEPKVKTQKNP